MISNRDEIPAPAWQLSEDDHWLIASPLFDTLPDNFAGHSEGDPDFLGELERRAGNPGKTIPAADLWKRD